MALTYCTACSAPSCIDACKRKMNLVNWFVADIGSLLGGSTMPDESAMDDEGLLTRVSERPPAEHVGKNYN